MLGEHGPNALDRGNDPVARAPLAHSGNERRHGLSPGVIVRLLKDRSVGDDLRPVQADVVVGIADRSRAGDDLAAGVRFRGSDGCRHFLAIGIVELHHHEPDAPPPPNEPPPPEKPPKPPPPPPPLPPPPPPHEE